MDIEFSICIPHVFRGLGILVSVYLSRLPLLCFLGAEVFQSNNFSHGFLSQALCLVSPLFPDQNFPRSTLYENPKNSIDSVRQEIFKRIQDMKIQLIRTSTPLDVKKSV